MTRLSVENLEKREVMSAGPLALESAHSDFSTYEPDHDASIECLPGVGELESRGTSVGNPGNIRAQGLRGEAIDIIPFAAQLMARIGDSGLDGDRFGPQQLGLVGLYPSRGVLAIDSAELVSQIFADGYESGDVSAWSSIKNFCQRQLGQNDLTGQDEFTSTIGPHVDGLLLNQLMARIGDSERESGLIRRFGGQDLGE